jgi:exopolysaccharide biosynthesis protein
MRLHSNNHKFSIFTIAILCFSLFFANLNVFAFGIDLNNIKVNELNNKTQVILALSKLPDDYILDTSITDEIKITLKETYLSTMLIKNLDIILDDNIKWKQYSDKLIVTVKHKGISSQASAFKLNKEKYLVIDIPSSITEVVTKEPEIIKESPEEAANSVKAIPPKRRPVNVSRSLSDFRRELPAFLSNCRRNPNNRVYHREFYPGVSHVKVIRNTAVGPLLINVIDIAPNNPSLKVLPILANERMFGKKTIRTITRENSALAGINAGFFKPPTGVPLGTLIIDDELISGPIYDRVTLGITRDEKYKIERIHLTGQLITEDNRTLKIDNVNQPRLSCNQYLLYSYRWGWKTPESPAGTKQIALVNGVIKSISADPIPIPNNGYVIAGPDKGLFSTLHVGDKLKLIVTTEPDWSDVKHAIGGGPFLVKNGTVYVDIEDQKFSLQNVRAPRTAVGVTKDDHLLLVTVDGRQKDVSVGVTFYELAALMIELGAVNAMNLDGGSSTQMCIGQDIVNSPTVSGGNNVSNGILLIPN